MYLAKWNIFNFYCQHVENYQTHISDIEYWHISATINYDLTTSRVTYKQQLNLFESKEIHLHTVLIVTTDFFNKQLIQKRWAKRKAMTLYNIMDDMMR